MDLNLKLYGYIFLKQYLFFLSPTQELTHPYSAFPLEHFYIKFSVLQLDGVRHFIMKAIQHCIGLPLGTSKSLGSSKHLQQPLRETARVKASFSFPLSSCLTHNLYGFLF